MSEKFNKSSEPMSAEYLLSEAAGLMREVAAPAVPGESTKAILRRVNRKLKSWSPSRVRSVWYADKRVKIRGEEIEQLRAAACNKAERDEIVELRDTLDRLARIEAYLERTDPEFFGEALATSSDQARESRKLLARRSG